MSTGIGISVSPGSNQAGRRAATLGGENSPCHRRRARIVVATRCLPVACVVGAAANGIEVSVKLARKAAGALCYGRAVPKATNFGYLGCFCSGLMSLVWTLQSGFDGMTGANT